MNADLEQKLEAARTAAVPALAAIGKTLHAEIDKLVALHGQAKVDAPWLALARSAASDLVEHLGSHVNSEAKPPGAAPAPETTAAA